MLALLDLLYFLTLTSKINVICVTFPLKAEKVVASSVASLSSKHGKSLTNFQQVIPSLRSLQQAKSHYHREHILSANVDDKKPGGECV